jgi:hypothetical protein
MLRSANHVATVAYPSVTRLYSSSANGNPIPTCLRSNKVTHIDYITRGEGFNSDWWWSRWLCSRH